ncbi:histidine kinase [Chroococcidiopsis sp. TS-821]|uniref:histidine kinase n=1 Tax=Chroococcidiopsis sp. TS-821 TaxID=1378066 RepID=UPI000CEDD10B|nr:histidine kinase [Chroococcidiopsis sp. TS-821]PPS43258.1 histidine kinase [Chroococcidiopsis sp. TS-821]
MQVFPQKLSDSHTPFQLLLFVDERSGSQQQIQQIYHYLKELQEKYAFELQIIDVGEQPYFAEHFKLVATPALIKIHPEPRQTLAGSNLIAQLQSWWPRWQKAVAEKLQSQNVQPERVRSPQNGMRSIADSAEVILMADEIFSLKREQEKLLEQLQFKDQVIAMLAHDLRNPLTAVSIALETLEAGLTREGQTPPLSPNLVAQLFKQARTQARSIDKMIAGLLQVARGTAAELDIQPQKVELEKLCHEVLMQLSDRARAKSLKIETDIPRDLPRTYADQERIRQVLINLLDNAIKYTPANGKIHISALHRTTQKIQFSVCDTGPGIPEENRDRIFEDRFRLERDKAKDGYGIGLCLCQRIIRAHYGQIWVDCPPTGGSCFHFTLPVYPN